MRFEIDVKSLGVSYLLSKELGTAIRRYKPLTEGISEKGGKLLKNNQDVRNEM